MDFATFMADHAALKSAMEARHSVRQYTEAPLAEEVAASLQGAIDALNEDHWLDLQLVQDEPRAFDCLLAKYGKFSGVRNYVVLVGPECKELHEILGYAGEKLVLYAQAIGLNTCWVGSSYKVVNRTYHVELGEELKGVIALGYGQDAGKPHKSAAPEKISKQYAEAPAWFQGGVDASLLAPTALNQQKFRFDLRGQNEDGVPQVKAHTKRGPFCKMDLGIAKLHFEVGAGDQPFDWV